MTIGPHPFTQLGIQQSIFQLGAQRATAASAAATGRSLSSFLGPAGAIAGGLFSVFGTLGQNRAIAQSAEMNIQDRQRIITQARVQRFMESDRLANEVDQVRGKASVAIGMVRGTNAEVIANVAKGGARSQLAINQQTENTISQMRQQQRLIAAAANSQMQNPVLSLVTGGLSGFMAGLNVKGLFAQQKQLEQAEAQTKRRYELQGETSAIEALAHALTRQGYNDQIAWNAQETTRSNETSQSLQAQIAHSNSIFFGPAAQTNPAVIFKTMWGTRFGR